MARAIFLAINREKVALNGWKECCPRIFLLPMALEPGFNPAAQSIGSSPANARRSLDLWRKPFGSNRGESRMQPTRLGLVAVRPTGSLRFSSVDRKLPRYCRQSLDAGIQNPR